MATYHDNLPSHPVISSVSPGYLRPLLPSSPPNDPEPFSAIREDFHSKIMPGISHWQSPNFMAFFPCSASFPGTLAELYSTMLTGAHFNWICSPAVTELETVMMDWLADAMGLPGCFRSDGESGGGGVIQGSASEAVLTVMVAARDKFLNEKLDGVEGEEREDMEWAVRSKLVVVASETAHSCTKKAARIIGVRFAAVPVQRETAFTLTAANLDAKLAELRAKGLMPFFLTATFGTTDTCAVDDFSGVAALPSTADLWIHMDGAYAGAALLCPEHRLVPAETLA
ncbi:MAG: aspartate aminotransferase family protein, partial [Acidobacteria bacterium]|nr:aspartate aminotransferase family protein [Acidobacteriota bacterium]